MKPINLQAILDRARAARNVKLQQLHIENPNLRAHIQGLQKPAPPINFSAVAHEEVRPEACMPISQTSNEIIPPSQREFIISLVPDAEKLSNEQWLAVEAAIRGESFCLVGKAGTGKTTTVKVMVQVLQALHKLAPMHSVDSHKWLKPGSVGAVCLAFTNRAINNISKSFDLGTTQINFMTIHKLLEYIKEEYAYQDKETGDWKRSFRFIPSRTRLNKLPNGLHLQIIEEASMVSKEDLHQKLVDASHNHVQFIYLGDLQQLPPIYGDGVLGYKLNELPTYELTKIYRQAAENPIIQLAWKISEGGKLGKAELVSQFSPRKDITAPIQITFWDKKVDWEAATIITGKLFCGLIDRGIFDWQSDIILIPYGKKFGSIELNKAIAQHLSKKAKEPTYEIIVGFIKHYYAVGDKVLYNKKEGVIKKITRNRRYIGRQPLTENVALTRDGSYQSDDGAAVKHSPDHMSQEEIDQYLLTIGNTPIGKEDEDDVSNQASHILDIQLLTEQMEDGSTMATVSTRGEYGKLELAYAITIHKAQGSESRKVFLVLHNSHTHVNRELLYTAVTRASQQLFIICEADSFSKGVGRQRIQGNTLQEKILWFADKIAEKEKQKQLKFNSQQLETEDDDS